MTNTARFWMFQPYLWHFFEEVRKLKFTLINLVAGNGKEKQSCKHPWPLHFFLFLYLFLYCSDAFSYGILNEKDNQNALVGIHRGIFLPWIWAHEEEHHKLCGAVISNVPLVGIVEAIPIFPQSKTYPGFLLPSWNQKFFRRPQEASPLVAGSNLSGIAASIILAWILVRC